MDSSFERLLNVVIVFTRFLGWHHRVHRVATAAFWRIFSDEGKISPGWWGWGVHAHPLSLHLPSPVKLQCTLQLSGQIHWPCFISTNICTLWLAPPVPHANDFDSLSYGLINYIDTKANCRHVVKKLTCKGTSWHVLIRVHILEIQLVMLVFFDPALWTVAPLPFSLGLLCPLPSFPLWVFCIHVYSVCSARDWEW